MVLRSDAIVIGSGFGGAAPALRLAEAGAQVTIIEQGPRMPPSAMRRTQDPRYLQQHLLSLGDEQTSINLARTWGGASPWYEMMSLRAPSLAFARTDPTGRRRWPEGLDRRTLAPWYELAEKTLGVAPLAEDRVPRTGQVFAWMLANQGMAAARVPMAVQGCQGAGYCWSGCVFGAKRSLDRTYLPAAEAAGAIARVGAKVHAVEPVAGGYRLAASDADGQPIVLEAPTVVLAGGVVGTAALLLRSRRALPGLSPTVGQGIGLNNRAVVLGMLPADAPQVDNFTGPSQAGIITWDMLEPHGMVLWPAKPLPLMFMATGRGQRPGERSWGAQHIAWMKHFRRRGLMLIAQGPGPTAAELRLKGGEPVLRTVDQLAQETAAGERKRWEGVIRDLLGRAGAEVIDLQPRDLQGRDRPDTFIGNSHVVGSCRMDPDPARGVVGLDGQVHGHPGLWISDASTLPSPTGVNPSLTILANAERIAAGIVEAVA